MARPVVDVGAHEQKALTDVNVLSQSSMLLCR